METIRMYGGIAIQLTIVGALVVYFLVAMYSAYGKKQSRTKSKVRA